MNYLVQKLLFIPFYFQHKDIIVETKLPDGYCCLLTNSHLVLYNFPYTIIDSMLLVNLDSLKCSPSPSHYYIVIVSLSTFSFKEYKYIIIYYYYILRNIFYFVIDRNGPVMMLYWKKVVTIGLCIFLVNQAVMNLFHGCIS